MPPLFSEGRNERGAAREESTPPLLPLLRADPDLASDVPEEELRLAERTVVAPLVRVPVGPWAVLEHAERTARLFGYYVLDGTLSLEIRVDGRALPQLLGPGDVLQPPVREFSAVPAEVRVDVLAEARIALLGSDLVRALARWPSVLGALQRRMAAQGQRLAALGAICQMPRVEMRVLTTLWLLAEEWGRVGPDGVTIPLALTHEQLGRFVGAQRPTVSLAVKELGAQDLVARNPDGTWLLRHGSDGVLAAMLAVPGSAPPTLLGRAWRVQERAEAMREDARAVRAEARQARERSRQIRKV